MHTKNDIKNVNMEPIFNYNDIPLCFSPAELANILDISATKAYELVREDDFPAQKIGRRWIINKMHFIEWLDKLFENN